MTTATTIDAAWLRANPLPEIDSETDKNGRGRVLLVGGSARVPGGVRLTGEAALRAGAGKVQIATIAAASVALGIFFPEAAVIALPTNDDGEIAASAYPLLAKPKKHCDALIVGPAMAAGDDAASLLQELLGDGDSELSLLLDAGAIGACADLTPLVAAFPGGKVMTPHHGEMAALTGHPIEAIAADPEAAALEAARNFDAVVVLKAGCTVIAAPDGRLFGYASECPGLATAGSGDVLAGVIGGLLARGAAPLAAAAWGVWLHGEAGRSAARHIGPAGFLARELLPLLPAIDQPKHRPD